MAKKKETAPSLKGGGPGGDSLADVGKLVTLGGAVPIVELPKVDLTDPEQLAKIGQMTRERAESIRQWMAVKLPALEQISRLDREAREAAASQVAEVRKGIEEFLRHQTPAYRRAAWLTLFSFEFSRNLSAHEDVGELLGDLLEQGYLREDSRGPLQLRDKRFTVSPESAFGEEETSQVKAAFDGLLQRVYEAVGQAREAKSRVLRQRSTMNLDELAQGKPGTCTMEIPPERRENGAGPAQWLGGGTLTVFSSEGRISVLDASGAIERPVQEAARLKVFLLALALGRDNPPFIRGLPPDEGRKVQLLWHLIRRAMAAEAQQRAIKQARDQLAAEATISAERFFLQREEGTVLAEFQGTWRSQEGSTKCVISHLYFLVRREAKEEGPVISLVAIPGHENIPEFFANCGKGYTEKGEDFEGIPHPLRRVLKAIRGQLERTHKIAPSSASTTEAPAEK